MIMIHKDRGLVSLIERRLKEDNPLIQVIVGPRQVGKTTALKTAIGGKGIYETADYPTPLPYIVIEEWWEKALKHPDRVLAIDEIQKIPGWSEVVKKLWESSQERIKLIVTGSSALLVEKGLRETLTGRFELIQVEHWNCREAGEILGLSIEKWIEFGCYPGSVPFLNDLERWGNYIRDSIVEPAIGRDLLQLHPVDHPALLRQIFGVVVSLPAQVISLQKLQGHLQGKGALPTIQHYLKLLRDAFLISGIEKYSKIPFKTKKSPPKLIVHDNALIRAFEKPIHQKLSSERWGNYFENSIGARFAEARWNVFYWKDRKLEVDYVVIGPENQKWAIEVKSKKTTLGELNGLFEFCKLHKDFEPYLISAMDQKLTSVKTLFLEDILSLSRKY